MSARARMVAVVGVVACGGIGIISSTQTWLTVRLAGSAAHALTATGAAAIPVLAPLSLAVLALGGVLAIAGLALRYVFGALTIVIAVAQGLLAGQVLFARPTSAVARTVTDATGITGAKPVADLIAHITVGVWPIVTFAAWVLLLAIGLHILATARRWPSSGRRYRTGGGHAAQTGPLDAVDSWDDLSRGADPTGAEDPR